MKFARIFSDFVENAEKRCNFSKFLDFNFDSIFKSIQFSNGLIFNFSIYFLIQLSLIRPPCEVDADVNKAMRDGRTPVFAASMTGHALCFFELWVKTDYLFV